MVQINFISSWAQGIIVSVVIATIIEMVLPEGNNGKYIKVVAGVFVLFTIISPILNKFSKNKKLDININKYIQTSTSELTTANANSSNDDLIKKMYEENLKIDIQSKISQKGYTVGNIDVEILNDSEYSLNKINVVITGKVQNNLAKNTQTVTTVVDNVEQVIVNVSGSSNSKKEEDKSVIAEYEKRKLIDYLSSVYEVKENNITIN